MSFKHKLTFFLVVVMIIATLLTFGLTANANIESTEIITDIKSSVDYSDFIQDLFKDDPLRYDAAMYASHYGITVNEGLRRLELQEIIGEMDGELTNKEVDTFAGLWIEHEPEFRVVALFTNNGDETIKSYLPEELTNIVQIRTVETSLAELVCIQADATSTIENLGIPVESEVNVYENRVKVYVVDRTQLDSMLKDEQLRLSKKVDVITVDSMGIKEDDIFGGLSLSTCTSGFGVIDSGDTRGITTAAHCGNSQSYSGESLDFVYELEGTYYDIQWHTTDDFTVTNEIQYNTGYYREITATLSRDNQSVGMYVAKYGKTTYRTAGHIFSKNYDPGYGFNATFIRVNNTYGNNLSSSGDSGGPWYDGNTAYGSHMGSPASDDDDAVYMAINYVSGVGVSVLTD